jgi:hypothetical protein
MKRSIDRRLTTRFPLNQTSWSRPTIPLTVRSREMSHHSPGMSQGLLDRGCQCSALGRVLRYGDTQYPFTLDRGRG